MTTKSSPSIPTRLALASLLAFSAAFFLYKHLLLRRLRRSSVHPPNPNPPRPVKILFASQTGTSKALAGRLSDRLSAAGVPSEVLDPLRYEPENLADESAVIIVASTWERGEPPPDAAFLARWLAETATDFRAGSLVLSRCRFAVFGVGSRGYGSRFNAVGRDFVRWMGALGGREMVRMGEGDVDGGDLEGEFDVWSERVLRAIRGENLEGDVDEGFYGEEEEEEGEGDEGDDVVDLEDVAGKAPRKMNGAMVGGDGGNGGVKEMVTPIVRKNLEKQVRWRLVSV